MTMIPLKANDQKDLNFTLVQRAEDSDSDDVVIRVENGTRWKVWDLTGAVVKALLKTQGQAGAVQVTPTVSDPTTGKVTVRVPAVVTAIAFQDGEQYRDVSLEFEVNTFDGQVETVPKDGYVTLRIYRDLNGA